MNTSFAADIVLTGHLKLTLCMGDVAVHPKSIHEQLSNKEKEERRKGQR